MHSATLLVLSALTALIVLAGAHWTAEHGAEDPLADSGAAPPAQPAGQPESV